jgi:hypothetical protein
MAGVEGLDKSGLVVDTAGVDDAAGLLQAAIAPTSARASKILLNMGFSSDCVPRAGEPGGGLRPPAGVPGDDRAVPVR